MKKSTTESIPADDRRQQREPRYPPRDLLPSYPSQSLQFLRKVQRPGASEEHLRAADGPCPSPRLAMCRLSIVIVGAGLGGLAAAIALGLKGHAVRVVEQAQQLGEVGFLRCFPSSLFSKINNNTCISNPLVLRADDSVRSVPGFKFHRIQADCCTGGACIRISSSVLWCPKESRSGGGKTAGSLGTRISGLAFKATSACRIMWCIERTCTRRCMRERKSSVWLLRWAAE